MKLLVNAGNQGRPMGSATAELIKSWGFDGVRLSMPLYAPKENLAAMIGELADHHLLGCIIVGGWEVWVPHYDPDGHEVGNTKEAQNHNDVAVQASVVAKIMRDLGCVGWIECGNEPDITKNMSPQRFVDQCAASFEAVREVNQVQPFVTGGVANLSKRGGLKYLRKCVNKGLVIGKHHGNVLTGVHPYRTHLYPWDNYEGRPMADILADVRNLCGPYAITELGWHTSRQEVGRWWNKKTIEFTDNDVKDFAEWDLDLGLVEEAEFYCWYNFNSGPTSEPIDTYGIREFNTFDVAKPVVESFVKWSSPA